jgi:peptide chain release factor subunit 1
MAKTTPAVEVPLHDRLEALARHEPDGSPIISLYLDLAPDQHGRESFDVFCRRAFAERLRAVADDDATHAGLARTFDRINAFLSSDLDRAANGLALFASTAESGFFETIRVDVPFDDNRLFVDELPHIYPLVRLVDQYPRYAVVALDTNHARIVVFALGSVERQEEVKNVKTRRSAAGGWSQARYQRHAENFHLLHVKEVAETLDRVVRTDRIQQVVIAGDEVVVPMLRAALPAHVDDKVIDAMRLDRQAGDAELAAATHEVLRQKDAETDRERVEAATNAWLAGGLGVMGIDATTRALEMGQVEELLIAATPADASQAGLFEELVTRAQQSAARVRMIEDPELLRQHGGVGAALRFRI